MKKILLFLFLTALIFNFSCGQAEKKTSNIHIKIETELGDMLIKLYDKTPQHRDNFVKLAREGFYDGLLFHRVIEGFMIQGGDPNSKNAPAGKRLGEGDPGYTIPAEFDSTLFHKRGALAAAREGDKTNPEKRSSGSQFYLVQGRVFSPEQIEQMLEQMKKQQTQAIMRNHFMPVQDELNQLRKDGKQDELSVRVTEIREAAEAEISQLLPVYMSENKKQVYSTLGGYPSLDDNYTVFGEVIEGLEVIDKIAALETDKNNRPKVDLKMKVSVLD